MAINDLTIGEIKELAGFCVRCAGDILKVIK